ncbi:cation-transporting P-type ATPase [Candidatus Saccharibacteria bacterium]|nr:cation-transporting P-type ATPase [Candidatus Saccharibacteria bacterium]
MRIIKPKKSSLETIVKNYSPDGLTPAEVRDKLKRFGSNLFEKERSGALRVFCRQFFNPLSFILVLAASLSFFMGEYSDAIVIIAIVLINSILSFIQEFRSEKAVEKLSDLIKRKVLLIRGGEQIIVDVGQIVPGDVIILRGGDIVPADVKIMDCNNLSVNESQLTGESATIHKKFDKNNGRSGLLFAGSVIDSGYCQGVIYATGNQTELGKIAMLSKNTKKTTPYQKSLSQFSVSLLKIIGVTIVLMIVTKVFTVHTVTDLEKMVLFTIALAITVVPEALPMITTISLSNGAIRLAKHKVVVKRLSSIEDLGRINILCTDKTGTLTQDRLSVTEVVANDETLFQTLAYASIEDLKVRNGKKHLNSFDYAFIEYVPEKIKTKIDDWEQLHSLPFDPKTRKRGVVMRDPRAKKDYLIVVGSIEAIAQISKVKKKDYHQEIEEAGSQGKRQLAIAYKEVEFKPDFDVLANEKNMTFVGFANLVDPLRPTTKTTIKLANDLGVEVKILTGDSVEVATYIGKEVGLLGEKEKAYTGDELDKMTIQEFDKAVRECAVFARVTPTQKYNIIQQLKIDHIVGYQGDGINDAPSLKLADASVAVKNATDVAKDSADIILLESDLGVIIKGIKYGRSIFLNINKYIKHAMIGNLGNFFSLAVFYVVFSTDLPMLPIQLLLANLIQDMPLMTIFSDAVDKDEVDKPLASNQIKPLMRVSMILGIFVALFYLAYFLFVGTAATDATRTNLFIFFNLTQLMVITSVRRKGFFLKGAKPSRLLLGTILLFAIGSVAITYIPFTADFMGFAPLPFIDLLILLGVAVAFIFALDSIKVIVNRWHKRKTASV